MSALLRAMAKMGTRAPVRIDLTINYHVEPNSYVAVMGLAEAGATPHPPAALDPADASLIRLSHGLNGNWHASLDVPFPQQNPAPSSPSPHLLSYKYVVVWPHKRRYEAIQTRRFISLQGLAPGDVVCSSDSFRAPNSNVFVTSAFTDAIFGPRGLKKEDSTLGDKSAANNWTLRGHVPADSIAVRFVCLVPRLKHAHTVHITGASPALGEWNPEHKLHMVNMGQHLYGAVAHIRKDDFPIEYKYAIHDEKDALVFRERFDPRRVDLPEEPDCKYFNLDEFFHYQETWKGAGVAVPVFSLRTETSMGVGEFVDLKKLVDWAARAGLQLIQVLPVNDTGKDPSPYSANSVFALHPIYLNLSGVAEDSFAGKVPNDISDEIAQAIAELNADEKLNYHHVLSWKLHILEKIFKHAGKKIFASVEFRTWWSKNMDWLPPYACWKSLLEATSEWDFRNWKNTVADVPNLIEESSEYYDRICFCYFVQYFLHVQLKDASDYAKRNGVALKGDLPIGVARYSADTWTNGRFFKMDWSAGAPPNGPPPAQNWDFPLYDWDTMQADGFSWWRQRLTHMNQYFHAFRIDHVLGFFRIWAIPAHNYSGLRGRLEPCEPVTLKELKDNHLDGDLQRLTTPYIRDWVLQNKFGERAKQVATDFLEEYASGCYKFKSEYDTQEKIDKALKPSEDMDDAAREINKKLKQGLFDLIDDVLVIQDESDPERFYPTCHMHFTTSFEKFGPADAKDKLSRLQHNFLWERQSWRKQGSERLGAIQGAAKMMVCAEDLGAVPPEVFEVLEELGILGLRIQRWPSVGAFGEPDKYAYLTVASPSCHDCSTVRGWWEEDRWRCEELFRTFFGDSPPRTCEDWVSQKVVEAHMRGSSMWAIMPLQDFLDMWGELRSSNPAEDAINRPGMKDDVWVYRMRFSLEQLMEKDHFNDFLLQMVERTGRLRVY